MTCYGLRAGDMVMNLHILLLAWDELGWAGRTRRSHAAGPLEQHQCSQAVRAPWFLAPACSILKGLDTTSLPKSLWQVLASAGYAGVRAQHLESSDSIKVPPLFEGSCPPDLFSTIPSLLYMLWKVACEIGPRTLAKVHWERLQVAIITADIVLIQCISMFLHKDLAYIYSLPKLQMF